MKKFSIKNLAFIPASHEDPKNPGVLKKVILTAHDIRIEGVLQMINWSRLAVGKHFALHYHEKMDEIFIILSGSAEIQIDNEKTKLDKTDTIYVPLGAKHTMKNLGTEDVEYLALGIAVEPGGKTIVC